MRYWWVNQNQTFDPEFHGGYLWSPKRKSNQARNPFYEFMRNIGDFTDGQKSYLEFHRENLFLEARI